MIKFNVEIEKEKDKTQALIGVEPLEQGFGHTIGNSLRRVMLSSLPGAAITSVKINGVSHQFSTISGVLEDVIEIILNLKKVKVKLYGDRPVKMGLLKSGEGEVTAADIDTQGHGEIVNPGQHIATISNGKYRLNMDLTIEQGVGYSPSDERKSAEIGVISVDATFTPVLSVDYTVDPTRVGRRTDFDKLTLDVKTDGTITPLEAVTRASQILSAYFKQIFEPTFEEEVPSGQPANQMLDSLSKISVEELDLPVRISNALKAIEVDNLGKLLTIPRHQLMKAKNLGAKSLSLISEKLAERGLSLSET